MCTHTLDYTRMHVKVQATTTLAKDDLRIF